MPVVYERGDSIEERHRKVDEFWNTGKLDTQSNVQFGEGGAGTFSDGKRLQRKQPIIILNIMRRLYMSFHMAELIIMRAQELRKKTGLL